MKLDAHCKLPLGFDEVLEADCDGDWIVIPRRYSLDDATWEVRTARPFVDYEYLGWPYRWQGRIPKSRLSFHAWVWDGRIAERIDRLVDENMSFQGSCWFTTRKHFDGCIGRMDDRGYGTFIGEAQELGLKTWLSGGKVMTNKKTWYAHLWKGVPYRAAYKKIHGVAYTRIGHQELIEGNQFCIDYWLNNRWPERKYDLSWLIERFWPVPSWNEDRSKWIQPHTS
jgi:hypothetical protein